VTRGEARAHIKSLSLSLWHLRELMNINKIKLIKIKLNDYATQIK